MKKISIILLVLVAAFISCKKTPEVNLKYVDVERDLLTVGTTTANIQCDYDYIATLKKAYLYYGEGEDETNMTSAEMSVVQKTLYVELTGLKENTTYSYYYEFVNGFNSMRSALKTFKTETSPGGITLPTVITAAVTEITTNSAKGGGEVTNDGGAEVTERGICWSTNANPTLNGNHIASGSGMGSFTAMMENLEANTTYHVRAYATNEKGTAYGLDKEFTTIGGGGCGVPEGAIDGLFSVSPTQKVYFSQGNLQYQASTNTWRFAENQWDYVGTQTPQLGEPGGTVEGSDNANISPSYSGWIDMFGWGTSGWNNGNQYFQPYDYEIDAIDGYGPKDDYGRICDLTGEYADSDWGVYNSIKNGGNLPNLWRTLTYNEWKYLLNERNTNSGIRYAKAIVNGINGLIVFPDNWNSSVTIVGFNSLGSQFDSNVISLSNWITEFEERGSAFLPAGGHRCWNKVYYVSSRCDYWTASCDTLGHAHDIIVSAAASSSGFDGTNSGFFGHSVRLVHNATLQPSIQIPTVITSNVSNVTSYSATCGGEVTNDGGTTVTERGICWSTSTNPTIDDNHVSAGTGTGSFTAAMNGLEANITYHVRAYATNDAGTAYGQDVEFTTLQGGGSGEHEYVDLGLPSGTLWATCNVGANAPEEYGDYFAWGEIEPKDTYNWATYKYCNGESNQLTKYCDSVSYGYNGFTDNLTALLPEDDAATANWGNGWRMPTLNEWNELFVNTTHTWTTQNGVKGCLFTASNGNSLFLPAAGYRYYDALNLAGICGYYWLSLLYTERPYDAWAFTLYNWGDYPIHSDDRINGRSVRPVRSVPQN